MTAERERLAAEREQHRKLYLQTRERRKLPEHLPRVDIEVLPPEVQQEGLAAFKRIGEEVSEVIERQPESWVVVRLVRPKFVRIVEDLADPSPVKIAEAPERPIERGLSGGNACVYALELSGLSSEQGRPQVARRGPVPYQVSTLRPVLPEVGETNAYIAL